MHVISNSNFDSPLKKNESDFLHVRIEYRFEGSLFLQQKKKSFDFLDNFARKQSNPATTVFSSFRAKNKNSKFYSRNLQYQIMLHYSIL